MASRSIIADVQGNLFARITDTESCVVIDDLTRIALLHLLGGFSRQDYAARSIPADEAAALDNLHYTLR